MTGNNDTAEVGLDPGPVKREYICGQTSEVSGKSIPSFEGGRPTFLKLGLASTSFSR